MIRRRALLALACVASACVYPDYHDANEAKASYEACVRDHGAKHPDCRALWQTYQTVLERYETNARTRWSCDPVQDECPAKR